MMSETLWPLVLAVVVFVGVHIGLSVSSFRATMIGKLGKWPYMALYSVLMLGLLYGLILAYAAAPHVPVFTPGTPLKHGALTLMLIAVYFIVAGYTTPSIVLLGAEELGLAKGPRGILKITRHPVLWGVALWGVTHMLATGDGAALIFFGGMVVLAVAGAAHMERRKRLQLGAEWDAFAAATSFWPLAAIIGGRTRIEAGEIRWWQTAAALLVYAGLLFAHAAAGRNVFPYELR